MAISLTQVFLGGNLDTSNIEAEYDSCVLVLSIPAAPHAQPRRFQVTQRGDKQRLSA